MLKYIIKRIFISIVILFAVLFCAYVLMYNLPENYAEIVAREMSQMSGSSRRAKEWSEILESEYGLNESLFKGFATWLSNSVRGDFGNSWYYGVPVTEKFYPAFINSFMIGLVSAFGTLLISVPIGFYITFGKSRILCKIISVLSVVSISIPVFFIVALLKYIFAIELGWFDLGGLRSVDSVVYTAGEAFCDKISHMILPVIATIIASSGTLVRYVHINIKELLSSRYIKGLRAKGLDNKAIIKKHLMRNAAVPVINIFCTMLPTALAGSIVIETLFSIDGIGYVAYTALINGDIPLIMFYILYTTFLTVGFYFLSDVLCSVADYRVSQSISERF